MNGIVKDSNNIFFYLNFCLFAFHLDINDCLPNPCLNGGVCTDRVNNYTCACAAGFGGRSCSVSKYHRQEGFRKWGLASKTKATRDFGACAVALSKAKATRIATFFSTFPRVNNNSLRLLLSYSLLWSLNFHGHYTAIPCYQQVRTFHFYCRWYHLIFVGAERLLVYLGRYSTKRRACWCV